MGNDKLKILWNITNKCGYFCDICATYSDRTELSMIEKKAALQSILSIGTDNITEFDFAGGDPLYDADSISIIESAINILGKEKVSVTTTGKGIINALKNNLDISQLLYNCELTIDCPDSIPNYIRKDISYITTNSQIAKTVGSRIKYLTVNVPILDSQLSFQEINKLVHAIASIEATFISVNLIRLMPVGKMNGAKITSSYNPKFFIENFQKCALNTRISNIHIHCALRGFLNNENCNMLTSKIGIDCSGNVFSCAWGGYISGYNKNNISVNPFYVGNILEENLDKILCGHRASKMRNFIQNNPTTQCCVYKVIPTKCHDSFDGVDPLFENK